MGGNPVIMDLCRKHWYLSNSGVGILGDVVSIEGGGTEVFFPTTKVTT